MKNPHDDLQRLLKRQDFQNEEELRDFLNSLINKPVPELSWDQLTDEEKAEEIIEKAFECGYREEVEELIAEALEYDPNCIPAFVIKSILSEIPSDRLKWLKKAVAIGEEKFGGAYEKENEGHFWGLHETRNYMKALMSYALELYNQKQADEAQRIAEKMLRLCPNDNLGIREIYSLWLASQGDEEKFNELRNRYPLDCSAFSLYNEVLLNLLVYGDDEDTTNLMEDAVAYNPYVVKWMLSKEPIYESVEFYNPGEENEAIYYCFHAKPLWMKVFGMNRFVKKFENQAKDLIWKDQMGN